MSDPFQTDPSEQITEVKFEELVGEGKRYRDPDAVAKAVAEKDRFIEQLKREAAEARQSAVQANEALAKRQNEAEFLDRMERLARGNSLEPQNPSEAPGVAPTAVTPEDIEKIIEEREAKRTREANLSMALSKLQETFGDDYKRHVQKQALALGMTTAQLTDMAGSSPQAFLRLVGAEGQRQTNQNDVFSPPPRTQVITQSAQQGQVKDYRYFSKLRQEKGEGWYFSLPVQKEVWEQAKTLGGDPVSKTGFWQGT